MSAKKYLDFDLLIEAVKEGYRVRVVNSPAGSASQEFTLPFNQLELENFILRLGAPRRGVRRAETKEMEAAKDFGERLYTSVLGSNIQGVLQRSLEAADAQQSGLRIRLHFDAPELAPLRPAFLDGAAMIYGHTALQRACGLGYQSEWSAGNLPVRRERNAFFTRVGRLLPPGRAGKAVLATLSRELEPGQVLALGAKSSERGRDD